MNDIRIIGEGMVRVQRLEHSGLLHSDDPHSLYILYEDDVPTTMLVRVIDKVPGPATADVHLGRVYIIKPWRVRAYAFGHDTIDVTHAQYLEAEVEGYDDAITDDVADAFEAASYPVCGK